MTVENLQASVARVRPFREGDPVAVLLHGRGSDQRDLQSLRPSLPESMALVTPRAPFPGAPWGYGSGWAWYRYVADDRVVPETLARSLQALDLFLDELAGLLGARPGPVILGGFSQGGTTSLAYGLTRPDRVKGVANFSGFFVRDPQVGALEDGVTPSVFWGHGTGDPAIPFSLAESGRTRLLAQGVTLEVGDYPIGHWIAPEELSDFAMWVDRLLAGPGTGGRLPDEHPGHGGP